MGRSLYTLIPEEVRDSVWIDPYNNSHLQCNICYQDWWWDAPDENKPMPRGWWKCPNGCWNDGLVQRMKEEGRIHDYNKIYVD